MSYRFHRAALAEYLDAVAYYENRVAGLGADYLVEFESLMKRICAHPDLYPVVTPPHIRKAGFRRFPYSVIYRAQENSILILALAHQRRRPAYWVGRLIK